MRRSWLVGSVTVLCLGLAGCSGIESPEGVQPTVTPPGTYTPLVPHWDAWGERPELETPMPPEPPPYSQGVCPTLTGAPDRNGSVITGFPTQGGERELRFIVPSNYDGSEPWPLVFGWHWLNASSGSFYDDAELATAAEQMEMLIVLPDSKESAGYIFDWPFVETWGAEEELVFFEDLLSCINEQYNVDLAQVHGIGVSAGALWITYLSTTDRIKYFASVESLSGGLGEDPFVWSMEWVPQPNKFPAIVLWGGAADWLGISFNDASIRYRDELMADEHFVVECVHDSGHAVPPIDPPEPGVTRFWALWQFMMDHPYGVKSPYANGLPEGYPDWCQIP